MAKDWEKYWLYLESYTFIFKGDDKTVLYNTLNSAYIECPSNDLIMYAIDSLFNSENYCIKISSEEYNDPEFYNFINIIRESFSGDCIPCNETANKPFIFKPILRLNDNFHKLESEDRIIEGHNILYYLNELSLYITDLCTLQCHHCADYNKQVLFCRKGNASADFPFKELDKILLHLSTSNIAKINFLGGNIFQYKYMQELINTIGEYRFKSHFFTHIEHINKHSVEIIKKILAKSNLNIDNIKEAFSKKFDDNNQKIKFEEFLKIVEKNEFKNVSFGKISYGMYLNIDGYYLEEYFILIFKLNFEQEIFRFSEQLDKATGVYFWVKDIKGNYITVNKKWLDEVGFESKESIEGLNSYDVWPKRQCDNFSANEKEVIEDNTIKIFEETFPFRNGDKTVDTTIWPLLDKDNHPIGTMGIAIDGKCRARFYENLNNNEKNFREITKYCDSVFFIRDEKNIIYMSPAYETIFEESCDYYAHDVYQFNNFFKNEEQKEGILKDYEFDKMNEGRAKAKLKNGKEKWIQYKFLPIIDEDGKAIKRIGILTDITKEVALEEEKEKIRLDFFANISHELRTPVNLILSSIQVLKLKLSTLDKENYNYFSNYINIMQRNTFRLVKLINNLIDSTKIDSKSIEIHPINSDIISFIEDTCSSVLDFVKSKNMNLIFDTDIEEEVIGFDPSYIERIMLNLLSNAIKFNKKDGNIFVNVSVNEKDVVVEVKDEGPGIPEEKIPNIFDRFEQVRSKMKSEREGTGIGLYIVKALVDLHNGTIRVNSEEKDGCSIIFTLPRKKIEEKNDDNIIFKENKANMIDIEFSDIYL